MLSENALREFKKIYLEEYGEEISDEQAEELGTNFLTIFQHIYHPLRSEWVNGDVGNSEPNKIN